MIRSSHAPSFTDCCICSSRMRDGTLTPLTMPLIVVTVATVFFPVFWPLAFAFSSLLLALFFSARITYSQSLCHCLIVDAQSVGHTYGKLGTATHGSKYLPQFNISGFEDLDHALGNFIGIEPPV